MEGLVIGLDLNDDYSQISCNEKEKSWTVPTVICRRKEKETWLIGEEAYAATLLGEGVIVDKLLKMVRKEGTSTIGGICYTGTDLLKIFLKKLLDCPFKEFHTDQVEQLVITMHGTDAKVTDCLMYCADYLNIPRDRVHVISHTESFAYYVLSQRKELWSNQVGLFELSEDRLCYYEMKVQRGMRRNMVQAEAQNQEEAFDLDILDSPSGSKLADQILCSCGEKLLENKLFSTVFLTGKGFERQDWATGFMKLACNRRRVFVENVLFSKGAAVQGKVTIWLRERNSPMCSSVKVRLKAEVALKVMRAGKEILLAVASYGDNWYESKSSLELILDGPEGDRVSHFPSGLPERSELVSVPLSRFSGAAGRRTTRIRMNIGFTDENTMAVVIRDMGFGELFPAS